jgi:hypothetical protein
MRCLDELADEFRREKSKEDMYRDSLLNEREYEEAVGQIGRLLPEQNNLGAFFSNDSEAAQIDIE